MILIFRVLAVTAVSLALPTHISDIETDDQLYAETKDWLTKYGYLQVPFEGMAITATHFNRALHDMRSFYNISNTAALRNNQDLRRALKIPRCGFPDTKEGIMRYHGDREIESTAENVTTYKRRKRFTYHGSKWDNSHPLTYRFIRFSNDMDTKVQRAVFKQAVAKWTSVANLTIEESDGEETKVDIDVYFASDEHGDQSPFDGHGGTLAHAFHPGSYPLAGDIHFDDDEHFSVTEKRGAVDYALISLHELGHSLGLGHSHDLDAVMAPSYLGFRPNISLHSDDIAGIQGLYGEKQGDQPSSSILNPSQVEAEEDDGHSTCTIIYDAVVNTGTQIYFFKDNTVWQTDADFEPESYPSRIGTLWEGGPDKVDAAFVKPDRSVVLFSGTSRWEYYSNSYRLRPGYPKGNSDLGGVPESVDDAVYVPNFGRILVFKDHMYWTLDPQTLRVQSGGINLGNLDIPLSINAVFYKDGHLFVLADQTDYYLYDFAPSFQRVLGYPKDFNLEKAGKLCGWCQTYSASVYNRSGTSSQVITWRVWFALLCSSSLAYHFQ